MVGRRGTLVAAFAFAMCAAATAETSAHQRIGVERKTVVELSPSISAELYREEGYGEGALSARASAGLGILVLRKLSFAFDMPFSGRLFTGRDSSPRFVYAPGDATASIGAGFRLADYRLALDASYSHPFGVYSYYESIEKRIASGSGYRTIAASIAATRFLDPLALGFRVRAETQLERPERFGSSSRLAAFSLGLFATEALNGEVALTASLAQGLGLPFLANGIPSWDITWLKTEVAGLFLYAYTVIDLFDRSVVGWAIETTESEEHAKRLFQRITRDLGVRPMIVHADNGNPMRGVTLAVFLESLKVVRSYSRPRCSNDNAFIESWHKTLKYTVGYPKCFTSLEHARRWYADFVEWYNTEHLHSGLGYVTPKQRRSGKALAIYAKRSKTLEEARLRNPLRWRRGRTATYEPLSVRSFYRPVKRSA